VVKSFVHRLRVRYHECDAQGVVFNAHYLAYVDVALTELWRTAFGSYDGMLAAGFDVMVADVHAAFRSGARFDDELDLALTIQRFGRTSMTTGWTASVGDRVCVEGEIVHVWVDATAHTPVPVPDAARNGLAAWTDLG
jgi:acyl-CoA thioester hydrolase